MKSTSNSTTISTSSIETLREVVNNEVLPVLERRDAAEHLIRDMVEAVPVPSADDPEVVELQKPWSDPFLAQMGAEVTGGRSLTGYTLKDAVETVHKRHQLRAVLAVVVDDTAHRLERLAACQVILDDAHPKGVWRINNYSAETLLEKVEWRGRYTANMKREYYRADPPKGERPPMELQDVWDM